MDILINVSKQRLKLATNLKKYVSGSQEFVRFVFGLNSYWRDLLTFAQFGQNGNTYNRYLDDENAVYLPAEIEAGECTLTLFGSGNNVIATTNYLTLTIDENILVSDASSTDISESLYEQLVDMVRSVSNGTTVVDTTSKMTDKNKIYVYIGSETGMTNGNWYYWNGTVWTSGGVWNAVAVETDKTLSVEDKAADGKAAGSLVEVGSTQPTSSANKIWIDPTDEEIEIPEMSDLNAVDAKVDDLKSDLSDKLNAYTNVDFSVTNKRVSSDGRIVTHNGFYITEYYQCTEGALVKWYGESFIYQSVPTMCLIAFYDANKTFISGITTIAGETHGTIGGASGVAPTGTAYVVCSTYGIASNYYCHVFDIDTSDFLEADTFNSLIIDGNQQNLFSKYNAYVGYLTESGNLGTDQPQNRTTDFIEVGDNASITLTTEMTLPTGVIHWQAFCFYDANKALIGSRYAKSGGTGRSQTYTIAIPSTAVYFRASSRAYNDWKIMLQFGDIASAWEYNYHDIDYIKEEVSDFQDYTIGVSNWKRGNVKAIAHRGSNIAPENTIAGFRYAVANGFDYIETDLAFTSDGIPVLLHDTTINRTARNADGTTIGSTINIYDITYEQASTYDFGIWKGSQYAGEKIPTLDEFLLFCRNTGVKPYLELKYDEHYPYSTITHIGTYFKKYGLYDMATVISFVRGYLTELKPLFPEIRIGYLCGDISSDAISYAAGLKTSTNEIFINASGGFTDENITACINAGLPIEMWTATTADTIKSINPYVSGITADDINPSEILFNDSMEN